MKTWQELPECGSRNKERKFKYATSVHKMIIDAIRVHPDIQQLKEIKELAEELERKIESIEIAQLRGDQKPGGDLAS